MQFVSPLFSIYSHSPLNLIRICLRASKIILQTNYLSFVVFLFLATPLDCFYSKIIIHNLELFFFVSSKTNMIFGRQLRSRHLLYWSHCFNQSIQTTKDKLRLEKKNIRYLRWMSKNLDFHLNESLMDSTIYFVSRVHYEHRIVNNYNAYGFHKKQ